MRWQSRKEPSTVRREIRIVNEMGLHARPAAQFVRQAGGFRSEIWLWKDDQRFSATSLIEVLRANLECGASAWLEAHGDDAEAAVDRLQKLLLELTDEP